jgi:hypothetical protein
MIARRLRYKSVIARPLVSKCRACRGPSLSKSNQPARPVKRESRRESDLSSLLAASPPPAPGIYPLREMILARDRSRSMSLPSAIATAHFAGWQCRYGRALKVLSRRFDLGAVSIREEPQRDQGRDVRIKWRSRS